jgi:hypothetical protein
VSGSVDSCVKAPLRARPRRIDLNDLGSLVQLNFALPVPLPLEGLTRLGVLQLHLPPGADVS